MTRASHETERAAIDEVRPDSPRPGDRPDDPPPPSAGALTRRRTRDWLVPVALAAVLVGLYFVSPGYQRFVDDAYRVVASGDQHRIQAWVRGFGPWGVAVLAMMMLAQAVVAFLPSVALMIASVLAYGPLWGGILAWLGMVLAATVGYGIGRSFGPVTVNKMIGDSSRRKLEATVNRYGAWAVVLARISPIISTDAISVVSGLVKMTFSRFIAATALGTLPLVLLISFFGSQFRRLELALIVVSLASIAALLVYAVWDRRRRRRAEDAADPA